MDKKYTINLNEDEMKIILRAMKLYNDSLAFLLYDNEPNNWHDFIGLENLMIKFENVKED